MAETDKNELLGNVPLPYSLEAEQSVLGAVLVDPDVLLQLLDILKPQYFYLAQHRKIYATMVRMFSASNSIDFVTLLNELKADGVYDEAGGKAYLLSLMQMVPSSANAMAYAHIVEDKYYLRSLINVSRDIIGAAVQETDDVRSVVDMAEQRIYDIRQDNVKNGLRPVR